MSPRARRAGSVRFDPYYKVQQWDPTSITWRDIQESHATTDAAREKIAILTRNDLTARYRIMEITEDGRAPLQEKGST